jgi:Nucleotidyl transferase AbiEii toxin, Type IV TA system
VLDALTPLQQRLVIAFAKRERRFFLTGGGVLVGFVFGHRATDDLDFFTADSAAMADADAIARALASDVGATVEALSTSPDHRRYLVRTNDDAVRVDFVFDRATQLYAKVERDGVLTDSTEEIFVNKICALVGRSEVRDLVDVMCLEGTGLRVEDYLGAAKTKDAGVSPATLAWLLSQLYVPEKLPGATNREALKAYAASLEARMRNAARPGND